MARKTAVLLSNLGTPKDSSIAAVGEFLNEFLMDPLVIPLPYFLRYPLVHKWIVPRRAPLSAHAYQSIWTDRGSPLMFHTMDLAEKLKKIMPSTHTIYVGMRYGSPSLEDALLQIVRDGADEILLIPLYPQYSEATTGSTLKAFSEAYKKLNLSIPVEMQKNFFWFEPYLDSVVKNSKSINWKDYDHVVFSFHGLPKKMIEKSDESKSTCYVTENCCNKLAQNNFYCYRANSKHTAWKLAQKLQIPPEAYSITFQSRLGRSEWIQPYTDAVVKELAQKGIKKILMFSPSFVADCLETLEELQIGLQKTFLDNGGEKFTLLSAVNESDAWVDALKELIFQDAARVSISS